ncbi:MAG: (Fe-S)-binding protein [Helicobacteraceae bacterium]|jgi:glycolate oxidase iron-sulfur subunit|nr:(Fe-S)-binding protein [Helicobacteraceae bacterium]
MKTDFDFSAFAAECVKCGKCIPSCTIHLVSRDETTSPRGFIHLLASLQNGSLEMNRELKKTFETCFLCTSCVAICPSAIPTDLLIENIRAQAAKKYGIAWYKRIVFALLTNRTAMDILAKLGFIVKGCAFGAEKNGMRARFTMPFIKKNRMLPSLKARTFLNSYPEKMIFEGRKEVAIFIGCMANYAYTSVGDSLLYILKKLKINAFLAKDQLCCGAPSYFTGDMKTTKWLIKYNIEYFELFINAVEAVLIPDATCSNMVIHDWFHALEGEPEWQERAGRIASKCFIASKWLYDNTDLLDRLDGGGEGVVTYHDPCHARKTQGVFKEPRAFLAKTNAIVEMSDPNRCCGFGGVTTQSERYDLAFKAGLPKAEMIAKTGADVVSAECSACRMQISDALAAIGSSTLFAHPLELIAKNLRRQKNVV